VTELDASPRALEVGPAAPTGAARTAHRPVTGRGATLTAGLLYDWQRRNREASLPLALRQLEVAGNLDNMRAAATAGQGPDRPGAASLTRAPDSVRPANVGEGPAADAGPRYHGPVFMDSDIYKTLEAIGWELAREPGSVTGQTLAAFAASTVGLLEQAQRPDGYLDSYVQVSGEPRYSRLSSSHEMYCAGHLIQAAVALHRTAAHPVAGSGTAARRAAGHEEVAARLLTVAQRVADHLVDTFAGQSRGLDGHPEIETALAELYRETGERTYLDLATQFVDQRGHGLAGDSGRGRRYLQDYAPVRQAVTLEGHAVRALYLEAGVADVATETGDEDLLAASIRRWEDMVATKTYLTGGNGSRHSDEAFGDRFELPPDRAYNETCAAIASFQWSWRLLLATGDARYADLMERVLYNAFGAAISTDGQKFFYVNPLQRRADHLEGDDQARRHEWFSCACCPPNIMRLLASVQHYLASIDDRTLFLHQFASAEIAAPLDHGTLEVAVSADLPWTGEVSVRVKQAPDGPAGLALRVPAWSSPPRLRVNGTLTDPGPATLGYVTVTRTWQPGDVLTCTFDVSPRWAYPHPRIDAVRGCVAVERGPLVYCFEQVDQDHDLDDLALAGGTTLAERPATLPGIGRTVLVEADARPQQAGLPGELPQPATWPATWPASAPAGGAGDGARRATAVPYFQWDNRDGRAMRVWLPAIMA
jgi:hypothetical protein